MEGDEYSLDISPCSLVEVCRRFGGKSCLHGQHLKVNQVRMSHQGEEMLVLPLIVMGSLLVVGGACSLLLPETLNQHLPQSLEDGEKFGKDWSWRNLKTCCPSRVGDVPEDKPTSIESPLRSLIQHHITEPKPVTIVEGTTPETPEATTSTTETISESAADNPEETMRITVV